MFRERRQSFRVEWNSPATIHDGSLERPCILSNFSNTGAKITGVEKGFDNFSARLIDLSGRYYSFLKDNVASMEIEYRSLMPSNYGRMFNPHELDDLLAYLASLGGEK